MKIVKCDNCGIEFKCDENRANNRRHLFCSKKCEGEYRRKNNPNKVPCAICGKPIVYKPSQLKKQKNFLL